MLVANDGFRRVILAPDSDAEQIGFNKIVLKAANFGQTSGLVVFTNGKTEYAIVPTPNHDDSATAIGKAFTCTPVDVLHIERFGEDRLFAVVSDVSDGVFYGQELMELRSTGLSILRKLGIVEGENSLASYLLVACEPPRLYALQANKNNEAILIENC